MNRFYVDAETDGLYGAFLSAAVLVTDSENRELEHFYGAVRAERTAVQSEWVRENVLPHLKQAEQLFDSEAQLLEAFWSVWMRHRESSVCIADVCSPVEARLFAKCVLLDLSEREFLAPYPLLDLSTLLAARGIDPQTDRTALAGLELTQHDAMNDVRMTAEIWHQLIDREKKAE